MLTNNKTDYLKEKTPKDDSGKLLEKVSELEPTAVFEMQQAECCKTEAQWIADWLWAHHLSNEGWKQLLN